MGMNDTPSSERLHIGFFGLRNAGKSSLVNAVTGQEVSVVSEVRGTTTDPVQKTMELLPLGPVVIIDTPGFDDSGSLGELRVRRTKQILNRTDVAVLVTDGSRPLDGAERDLIRLFEEKKIPYIVARNKADLPEVRAKACLTASGEEVRGAEAAGSGEAAGQKNEGGRGVDPYGERSVWVSALEKTGIEELKNALGRLVPDEGRSARLVPDFVQAGDVALLVVPIDKAAPKGRLILPQQQVIRDLLDRGALAVVTRETELEAAFAGLARKPSIVITDSQVFDRAAAATPGDVPLTSFSILMANYKGFLASAVRGAAAIDGLKDGDRVLISEGCTHHRQCEDIGTVKIPKLLKKRTGADLRFETSSGGSFPDDLSGYALVIHCGACMLNQREVLYRMKCAADQNVPFTNYGTAIASMHGILRRGLSVFPELAALAGRDPG